MDSRRRAPTPTDPCAPPDAADEVVGEQAVKSEVLLRWPPGVSAPDLLNALDSAGYRVRRTGGRERTEVHWDTHDGVLGAAGATLVRHVEDGRWEFSAPHEIVAEPGTGARPPAGGRLAAALAAATREERVIPYITGRIDEEVFRAAAADERTVRVALRHWVFTSPLRPGARARRAFVHVAGAKAAAERAAGVIHEVTHGRRVDKPLLELALAALHFPVPGQRPPASLEPRGADAVGESFAKLLARQAWVIAANAPGVAADLDAEFVHDLRVATRRARAALRLTPRAGVTVDAKLGEELAWLARACGPLRDLDVFLVWVAAALATTVTAPEPRQAILMALGEQRSSALAVAEEAVTSPHLASLLGLLRQHPLPGAGAAATAAAAPPLVIREVRVLTRWRKREPEALTEEELHRVRIAAKRARYALEFFAPALPVDVRRAVRGLVRVQDTLGAHHDAVVAVGRIEELARTLRQAGASLDTLLALGGLRRAALERQRAQQAEFVVRAPRLWRRLAALRARLAADAGAGGAAPAGA
jgi:CHAD domain-containing protein